MALAAPSYLTPLAEPVSSAAIRAAGGIAVWRNNMTVIVPDEIEVDCLPLGVIRIPLIVTARSDGGYVTSVRTTILGKSVKTPVDAPMTSLCLHPREIGARLSESSVDTLSRVLEHGAYRDIYMDLRDIQVSDGMEISATVTVEASIGRHKIQDTIRVPLRFSSLPKLPGWYGGDGHVHTVWSPDVVLLPIEERARYARDMGFGFLIITDHEDGIREKWSSPGGYCEQCRAAAEKYGLPVLPGVEIAVKGSGHCLAYCMKESAASVPANRSLNATELLRNIQSHNWPHSYGIVAHPFAKRERWSDWSARGLAGIEIINRSRRSKREAIQKWFNLLNGDLPRTLLTGEFVVGLAHSDCHNLQDPGSKGFTWIKPRLSTLHLDPVTVWETIRRGSVVASGSKDLGFFTLNGRDIGSVVPARTGSTLAFDIEHHPSGGRRCTRVAVISGDGHEAVVTPERPGAPFRYETRCPRKSTFYVVKFNFSASAGRRSSEVWTNPIFVRRSG